MPRGQDRLALVKPDAGWEHRRRLLESYPLPFYTGMLRTDKGCEKEWEYGILHPLAFTAEPGSSLLVAVNTRGATLGAEAELLSGDGVKVASANCTPVPAQGTSSFDQVCRFELTSPDRAAARQLRILLGQSMGRPALVKDYCVDLS